MPRIIGIDPGSRITGFGIIDLQGNQLSYVDSGAIDLRSHPAMLRLAVLHDELSQIVRHHQPDDGAIEEVFVYKSVSSALKLGQARGVALLTLTQHMPQVSEYTARQVKAAVVGSGAAAKSQVEMMVKAILKINFPLQSDAADALAIGITHCYHRQSMSTLKMNLRVKGGRIQ